jgi:hypothetical protein
MREMLDGHHGYSAGLAHLETQPGSRNTGGKCKLRLGKPQVLLKGGSANAGKSLAEIRADWLEPKEVPCLVLALGLKESLQFFGKLLVHEPQPHFVSAKINASDGKGPFESHSRLGISSAHSYPFHLAGRGSYLNGQKRASDLLDLLRQPLHHLAIEVDAIVIVYLLGREAVFGRPNPKEALAFFPYSLANAPPLTAASHLTLTSVPTLGTISPQIKCA